MQNTHKDSMPLTTTQQYSVITASYWSFTLTDGALRMLVILFFHELGYGAFDIAMLFLFYEFFGVITNLVGGWLGAKIGLNKTMHIGLLLQIIALSMLLIDSSLLSIAYVMIAQALSGIAKDLNKMSAKSSVKLLLTNNSSTQPQNKRLYHWVALLTGSKNALKGIGFFLGALSLSLIGFWLTILSMIILLSFSLIIATLFLKQEIGKTQYKVKFTHLFSSNPSINYLSAARLFLFGARDIWFVVAIPVYFQTQLNWTHTQVGLFMAAWIIAYGIIQAVTPLLTSLGNKKAKEINPEKEHTPNIKSSFYWIALLSMTPAIIAYLLGQPLNLNYVLIIGLLVFGFLFAINSSIHSYLILHHSRADGASLDVGFYYMANALGRLVGTVLSGYIFQYHGLQACLYFSSLFLIIASIIAWQSSRKIKV